MLMNTFRTRERPTADNNMRKALLGAMIGCVIAFCPFYLFYLSTKLVSNVSEPDPARSDGTTPVTYRNGGDTGIVTDGINAAKAPERLNATSSVHLESLSGKAMPGVKKGGSVRGGSSPASTSTGVGIDRFLYLLQTEACLPSNLRAYDALGNGSLDFDVLVLSFKALCDDVSLSHVEYISGTSTTWTTGRNLLFETAMKRNTAYLYYIFMDDDVTVVDLATNAIAWRKFEKFLRFVEPAVVGLDLPDQDYVGKIEKIHRDKSCSLKETHYVAGLWYDAMVNAFHRKAVRHLLPYDVTFDQQTWWASQMGLIVRSEVLFRGQVVLPKELRALGSQNRPYPRSLNFTPDMYRQFTKGLDAHIAPGCVARCARILIDQWVTFGNQHGWDSSTLCLPPPPPRDPIRPCHYQCSLL